jgi:hypothetical protein
MWGMNIIIGQGNSDILTQISDYFKMFLVIVNVDGVSLCLLTAASDEPIVHPTDDVWEWRATVE